MIVGAALVEIHVHGSQSLKQKRGVVRSIQQRLRNRFNLSVSEVGGQGTWQRAVLGLSAAGAEAAPVKRVLERAIVFVEELHLAEVLNSDLELLVLPHEGSASDVPGAFEAWDADGEDDDADDADDADDVGDAEEADEPALGDDAAPEWLDDMPGEGPNGPNDRKD